VIRGLMIGFIMSSGGTVLNDTDPFHRPLLNTLPSDSTRGWRLAKRAVSYLPTFRQTRQ